MDLRLSIASCINGIGGVDKIISRDIAVVTASAAGVDAGMAAVTNLAI